MIQTPITDNLSAQNSLSQNAFTQNMMSQRVIAQNSDGQSSKILIIDDDPFGRDALGLVLESNGYALAFASNGPEGILRAAEVVPDVILLDVMMPGMDGFEVCQHLRADSVLGEVPVLMITALDDRSSRLQGIQAGADDFITKPIDSVELLARVQGITRLNRYRHLLNQRHRFEWVLDKANDGYLVLNDEDLVVFANPTARRYFSIDSNGAKLEGLCFPELVRARYQCEPAGAWERSAVRPYDAEESLYLIQPHQASSPPMWLQVTILDQVGSGHNQRLLRVQDVSAQMETQQAMWAFQSMVRHKLNTPMHGMASCLNLLTSQPLEAVSLDELNELVQWTQEAMLRLEKSVASVLRHTQAREIVQWGDRVEVRDVPRVIEQVAASLALKTVTFAAADELCGCYIRISQAALECIFNELLENARKFHPCQTPAVTITAEMARSANDLPVVRFRVADDGILLSPAQLEKIWVPYYQVERNFTGEVPGMGLGLSQVRAIVWQIGGSCAATNRADGPGLVVEIVLPLSTSSET